jgi:hypothetical protein
LLDSTCSSTRNFGFSRATIMMVWGMRLSAGPVMAPRLTWPESPDFKASTSCPASRNDDNAMRAWRIMVSPYQLGPHAARLPVEQRDAEHVLEILEQLAGRGLGHVEHFGGAMDVAPRRRWR